MSSVQNFRGIAAEVRACAQALKLKVAEAKKEGLIVILDRDQFYDFVFDKVEKDDGITLRVDF
jgi:hypothetical protein